LSRISIKLKIIFSDLLLTTTVDIMAGADIRSTLGKLIDGGKSAETVLTIKAENCPVVSSGVACSCWNIENEHWPGIVG
jgi:hypothetical protein